MKRRQALIEKGVKLPEGDKQSGQHGVVAPGYNPKDTAETFVKKIMVNQDRMKRTIERYEQE